MSKWKCKTGLILLKLFTVTPFFSHPPPTARSLLPASLSAKKKWKKPHTICSHLTVNFCITKKLNFKNWKHCQFLLCLVTMQCALHLFLPYSPILRDFSSHPFYKPFPCVKEMHPLISFLRFLFKILIRLKWELRNCYFSNLVENCFFFFLSLIILT